MLVKREDTRLCVELTGGHVTPSLRPWPGSPVGASHQDFFLPKPLSSVPSSSLVSFSRDQLRPTAPTRAARRREQEQAGQVLVAIKGEPLILILLLSMISFISSRLDCFSQGLLQLREEKLKPDLLHC
jgi:hypothetical protein